MLPLSAALCCHLVCKISSTPKACGVAVAVRSGRCPVRAQESKVRFADDLTGIRLSLPIEDKAKGHRRLSSRRTFCVIAGDVLRLELASPPYTAVTLCRPLRRAERDKVAHPFTTDAAPSTLFLPCLKDSVPGAAPPYCPTPLST